MTAGCADAEDLTGMRVRRNRSFSGVLCFGLLWFGACDKVPLTRVNASFSLADAAWFEQEATLFVFYRVSADQGLDPRSVIEVRFETDNTRVDWTPIRAFESVHRHVPVCQDDTRSLCGSTSIRVVDRPRNVQMRMRFREESPLGIDAAVNLNTILHDAAWNSRSLLVYGVFDEVNSAVQWRARHRFPTLRNSQVQDLGLRRWFSVTAQSHGDIPFGFRSENPYGYGFADDCRGTLLSSAPRVSTDARAVFMTSFGTEISSSPMVCGASEVVDGLGVFSAVAMARKNPEVEPAFPVLRSPVRTTAQIGTLLTFCDREISAAHEAMQVQRLQLERDPVYCLDDWEGSNFVVGLVEFWANRIEDARTRGDDMVLKLALHHDDTSGRLADRVQAALVDVLVPESLEGSPRVVGAFVLDSFSRRTDPRFRRLMLWCPNLDEDDPTVAGCTAQSSAPVSLGPFSLGTIPILPTRREYQQFVAQFSEDEAGETRTLSFRAPELTPTSEIVPVDDFAMITFFNEERVSGVTAGSFSICPSTSVQQMVFRRRTDDSDTIEPLSNLPFSHATGPLASYEIGLFWDFPFLTQLDYEVVLAAGISAFSVDVTFGTGSDETEFFGSSVWEQEEFPLGADFLVCTRFCGHPTFDGAKVYNVNIPFEPDFFNRCYRPRFPAPGDGGFPDDP